MLEFQTIVKVKNCFCSGLLYLGSETKSQETTKTQ